MLNQRAFFENNIIYITPDEAGYEISTYNGGNSYSTSNLDFMAVNRVLFPNFFRIAPANYFYNIRLDPVEQ